MKLQDCRKAETDSATKASDIARNLAFAGIALVWVFKYDSAGQTVVPKGLVWPTIFIVIALSIDLFHYVFKSIYWGWLTKKKEEELVINPGEIEEHFDEEREFTHPRWYIKVTDCCFYCKIGSVAVAYILITIHLVNTRLFQ
jgi:hypothetical protein